MIRQGGKGLTDFRRAALAVDRISLNALIEKEKSSHGPELAFPSVAAGLSLRDVPFRRQGEE